MANTKSALKRIRQAEGARARNASIRSSVRTAIKKVRAAVGASDTAKAQEMLRLATKSIDQAASKGVFNARAASRKISRLAKSVATPPAS